MSYIFYDFYNGYFLFLHNFLVIFWLFLIDFLLLLLFYRNYSVVGRVMAFFGVETW